jgi:hypothetical protein
MPASANDKASLQKAYQQAIEDAKVAERDEISKNLVAVYPGNPNLVWQEKNGVNMILVATWTNWDGYNGKEGQSMMLQRDVWITCAPQLKNFCRSCGLSGSQLDLRLRQLLGLPPDDPKTTVVEMWVSPDDLFRPSPDPEICDYEAQLDVTRSRSVCISPYYIKWYNHLKATSYGKNGYPWTRLGYTYDWGNPKSEIGLSEFVIGAGSNIIIHSVTPTAAYHKK